MIRLHGSQSTDTPVGCDRDRGSKSNSVSTSGHLVIYTEFTSLYFNLTGCNTVVYSINEVGPDNTATNMGSKRF